MVRALPLLIAASIPAVAQISVNQVPERPMVARDTAPSEPAPSGEIRVRTENGEFVFVGARLIKQAKGKASLRFVGTVENRTGHRVKGVRFYPDIRDKRGKSVSWDYAAFRYSDFKAGGKEPFDFLLTGLDADSAAVDGVRVLEIGHLEARYAVSLIAPAPSDSLAFQDASISVQFGINREHIQFSLKNKESAPMRLDWNQSTFVDCHGKTLKVIHSGVRLMEANSALPPSVIPPGALLEDIVYPASYASYSTVSGWIQQSMFPNYPLASQLNGCKLSIMLHLEGQGSKDYLFTLAVSVTPE